MSIKQPSPATTFAPASKKLAILLSLAISIIVIAVYSPLFHAGFSGLDDDIQVYKNPFLNPPTPASILAFWYMPYRGLYVPLAYTLFGLIAHFSQTPETFLPSLGETLTVAPVGFHAINIAFHAANSVLVFLALRYLIKRDSIALLCALIFALHPLQVESVAWVSELRGLSGSFFALVALNLFLSSRSPGENHQAKEIRLLFVATVAIILGILCKPSIVAMPFVTLAIDRIVFNTPWRKTLTLSAIWILCALPFLAITHSLQQMDPLGASQVWQRPFVAGDALAFYMVKTLLPINLCIDYGRTPIHLFTHRWSFVTWLVPAAGLLLAYKARQTRPLTWLGALIFALFFLPVLGLVPFAYQNFSTVSDRYAYLSLLGIALIIADTIAHTNGKTAYFISGGIAVACAAISIYQTQFWMNETVFLYHTLDINPRAAFAYNNLGELNFGDQNYPAALSYYLLGQKVAPGHPETDINAAKCYLKLNEPVLAHAMLNKAFSEPKMNSDNYSDAGNVFMDLNDPTHGLRALAFAVQASPGKPSSMFNYANGLMKVGNIAAAEKLYKQCIATAPSLPGPYVGLGVAYAQTGNIPEAEKQFAAAVALEPSDPTAIQNLRQAQQMLGAQPNSPH